MHDGHRCHRKKCVCFFLIFPREQHVTLKYSQLRLFDQCFAVSFLSLEVKSILTSVFPGVCCAVCCSSDLLHGPSDAMHEVKYDISHRF